MVGTIGTIYAIEARENIMDARAHPVSSCLNSPAIFSFKPRPRRLIAIAPNPHCVRMIATITRKLGSTNTVAKTRSFLRAENTFFV